MLFYVLIYNLIDLYLFYHKTNPERKCPELVEGLREWDKVRTLWGLFNLK